MRVIGTPRGCGLTTAPTTASARRVWLTQNDCRLEGFPAVVEQETDAADYPCADRVEGGVLIHGDRRREGIATAEGCRDVQAELVRALLDGPGIAVFDGAFPDTTVIDRASDAFFAVIEEQKAAGVAEGDHFAKPGANDRVWGTLDKLAVRKPRVFADYYANDVIALVSTAWLGPDSQVTSQVNVVNPGGQAQVAHRDYHLSFMSSEQAERFPAHVHRLSPALTLQGRGCPQRHAHPHRPHRPHALSAAFPQI
jgi:hypothetical protein